MRQSVLSAFPTRCLQLALRQGQTVGGMLSEHSRQNLTHLILSTDWHLPWIAQAKSLDGRTGAAGWAWFLAELGAAVDAGEEPAE